MEVKDTLREYGIEFRDKHASVSRKCVGVCCPWCEDEGYHLGVFLDGGNFNCWKCSQTGSLRKLVFKITGRTLVPDHAESVADQIKGLFDNRKPPSRPTRNTEVPEQPPGCIPIEEAVKKPNVQRFLQKRNSPELVYNLQRFGCSYCDHPFPPWTQRFIIPVVENGDLKGWSGRDVSGLRKSPWRHDLCEDGILYGLAQKTLYQDRLVIVEGVFDAWTASPFGVATLGSYFNELHLRKVLEAEPCEVVVAWDGDVLEKAIRLAEELAPLFPIVKVPRMEVGEDPNSIGAPKFWERVEQATPL